MNNNAAMRNVMFVKKKENNIKTNQTKKKNKNKNKQKHEWTPRCAENMFVVIQTFLCNHNFQNSHE
jgi:hypothetical protein